MLGNRLSCFTTPFKPEWLAFQKSEIVAHADARTFFSVLSDPLKVEVPQGTSKRVPI